MALPANQKLERLYTATEFAQLPEFNERYELIDGRLVEKPVPKYEHSDVSWVIQKAYDRFDPDEKLGVMRAEVSVSIRDDYTPAPDLSFWVISRKPTRKVLIAPYPDLAIEIQSLGQSLKELREKAQEYLKAGVKLVWIIQPGKKIVEVFREGQKKSITIQPTGELDGGDVIPDFKLSLAKLFE